MDQIYREIDVSNFSNEEMEALRLAIKMFNVREDTDEKIEIIYGENNAKKIIVNKPMTAFSLGRLFMAYLLSL